LNIFRIRIEFRFKNITHQNIIESIKLAFEDRFSDKEGYVRFIQQKWENLKQKNIKALYEPEQVIVRSETSHNTYFIVNEEENNDKNKSTLTIIIFSKENDANMTINDVINDMKVKLEERKIKLFLPRNSDIVMYLFDNKANDIVASHYVINYEVETVFNLNKREKTLTAIMALLTFFLTIYNKHIIMAGVKESLIASALFLIVTNIISNMNFSQNIVIKKMPELYNLNYEITNEELEKFYTDYYGQNAPQAPSVPQTPSVPQIPIKK
jgi:hypothetical protein